MSKTGCCETGSKAGTDSGYEVVRIEKANGSCSLCEEYAERQQRKPVVVMSCEGACLRGEVSRQAANILCHTLAPEKTVRLCLGGAFTKDTGQRGLVRNAPRLIALEGCPVNCASRMMSGVIAGLAPEIIRTDRLCDFDRKLFGIDEMPPEKIQALARTVAGKIALGCGIGEESADELNYREWIEAIDAPILLLQADPRQVVTANSKALALFEKKLHDVAGRRGGQVFDCIHAFTADGCGKDSNCEGCRIRDAIIDTFATGRPHNGVATSLQIKKANEAMTYVVQVATEKVGNLALVRIERFDKG